MEPNPMSLSELAAKNPVVVHPKLRPVVAGVAVLAVILLALTAGKLLYANYWPQWDDTAPVVIVPTATPGAPSDCYYHQVQCIRAPCPPELVCPSPSSGVAVTRIVYSNAKYGLRVTLPATWKGYTVTTDTWSGTATTESVAVITGPTLHIVHPLSTKESPRQDIPIMVLTMDQWNRSKTEDWSFGAAPIGPSELARNTKYVFALPARYNYAFPTGFEEVEMLIATGAVSAF